MTASVWTFAQNVAWLDLTRHVLVEIAKRYPEVVVNHLLRQASEHKGEDT